MNRPSVRPAYPSASPASSPSFWPAAPDEPALDEVLADPLLHLILRRDRLTVEALAALLAREQRRLGRPFRATLAKAA